MTHEDLKVYALNAVTFSVSMSQVELYLKIFLLIVSIGYTIQRWYLLGKKKEK